MPGPVAGGVGCAFSVPNAEALAAEVGRAQARGSPFIDRSRLFGLVGEVSASRSMADLP